MILFLKQLSISCFLQFVKMLCQFTVTGGIWHRNFRGGRS